MMWKTEFLLGLGLLLPSISLTGCGTAIGMSAPPAQLRKLRGSESKVYVGVVFDANIVVTGPSEILGSKNPLLWLLGVPIYLYCFLDLVPSALLDSLLLPLTLSSGSGNASSESPKSVDGTDPK
jgi:hypothetical protein